MFRLLLHCTILAIAICCAWAPLAAQDKWAAWPPEPVMVSATEGIVEMFVHRQLKAVGRWHGEHGSLSSTWDSCSFRFGADRVGDSASMTREYDLAVGEFRRLRMRL